MAQRGRPLAFSSRDEPPFPWRQMIVLAICRICEPIAFMSIFPYAYDLVETFQITTDKSQISVYMGMITSAFAFAEFASSVFWGRLSDRIGRKPVLLGGLFGTGLSMVLLGFAKSFPMVLFARVIGGLLNGNIGVLQTTVAELVTVEKYQPRAFSIMPFVWCLGTIVGSALGGMLTKPANHHPIFQGTLFDTYPYLLPNLACAAVVVLSMCVGFLFLQETHEDAKYERDRGYEIGQWITRKFSRSDVDYMTLSDKDSSIGEFQSILASRRSSSYRSTDSSPTLCSSRASMAEPPPFVLDKDSDPTPEIRTAFTKQVCLNVVSVGILAFHTISLETLIPILMQNDAPQKMTQFPFKFTGGFHYDPAKTGAILAFQGFMQMFAQIVLFPRVNTRLGSLRTFWIAIASYPFLYLLAPYLMLLPTQLEIPGLLILLSWKVTAQAFSYPSLSIILANSAPSKKVLGTLYGATSSSASVCRGLGPTIVGAVNAIGESNQMAGLGWWCFGGIALSAWAPALLLTEKKKQPEAGGIGDDEEAVFALPDDDSDTESVATLSPDDDIETVLPK